MIALHRKNPGSWRPRFLGGCLLVAFLLMAGTSQDIVRPFAGEAGAKAFQAYGAYVWASVALIVAHLVSLRALDSDPWPSETRKSVMTGS